MSTIDTHGNLHDQTGRFTQKPHTPAADLDTPFDTNPDTTQTLIRGLIREAQDLIQKHENAPKTPTSKQPQLLNQYQPAIPYITQARQALQHAGALITQQAQNTCSNPHDGQQLAQAIHQQLTQIRPMGCTINITNHNTAAPNTRYAVDAAKHATRYYPADWKTNHPILIKNTGGRASKQGWRTVGYYIHNDTKKIRSGYTNQIIISTYDPKQCAKDYANSPEADITIKDDYTVIMHEYKVHYTWQRGETRPPKPKGPGWEWWQRPDDTHPAAGYWRRPKNHATKTTTSRYFGTMNITTGTPTAAHEIAHLWEHEKPIIGQIENDYYQHRYTQALENQTDNSRLEKRDYHDPNNMFPDTPYMAHRYGSSLNFEILSTGVESVFCGSHDYLRHDPETRDLIVGMLATIK